eukprot:scaffold28185_cov121-Skeletonema_dohrnii-CCMP3373.AAC.1
MLKEKIALLSVICVLTAHLSCGFVLYPSKYHSTSLASTLDSDDVGGDGTIKWQMKRDECDEWLDRVLIERSSDAPTIFSVASSVVEGYMSDANTSSPLLRRVPTLIGNNVPDLYPFNRSTQNVFFRAFVAKRPPTDHPPATCAHHNIKPEHHTHTMINSTYLADPPPASNAILRSAAASLTPPALRGNIGRDPAAARPFIAAAGPMLGALYPAESDDPAAAGPMLDALYPVESDDPAAAGPMLGASYPVESDLHLYDSLPKFST